MQVCHIVLTRSWNLRRIYLEVLSDSQSGGIGFGTRPGRYNAMRNILGQDVHSRAQDNQALHPSGSINWFQLSLRVNVLSRNYRNGESKTSLAASNHVMRSWAWFLSAPIKIKDLQPFPWWPLGTSELVYLNRTSLTAKPVSLLVVNESSCNTE
jgi:hypothetical protein